MFQGEGYSMFVRANPKLAFVSVFLKSIYSLLRVTQAYYFE